MFESLLPAVTLVALGLLVPAALMAMLLARGRHASTSVGGDRRGRVAIAAATVAVAGGPVAWFLGSGVAATAVAALVLATPVAVWAYLAPWWPVRAVVAWAMLVTGSVGTVGMAAARALESPEPWTAVPVTGAGSAVVVFVLGRLNGPFRRLLGIRAGVRRAVRTPLLLRPALLRPALAVAVFFAALAAGGLTGVAPRPGERGAPEAGSGPDPGEPTRGSLPFDDADVRPVSAQTVTPSESAPAGGRAVVGQASGSGGSGTATGSSAGSTTGSGDGTTTSVERVTAGEGSTGGTSDSSGRTATSGSSRTSDDTDRDGTQSDPTTRVSETVADTTDAVEDSTGTVEDGGGNVLDPVQTVVEDTVDPVQTVVEDTVEQVTDPIGSALP